MADEKHIKDIIRDITDPLIINKKIEIEKEFVSKYIDALSFNADFPEVENELTVDFVNKLSLQLEHVKNNMKSDLKNL